MHEAAVYPAEDQTGAVMTGRKTLLTPELQQAICDNITAGLNQEDAAEYAGVPLRTFYNWLQRGEREEKRLAQSPGAKPQPREAIFLQFWQAVKKARLDFKRTQIRNVKQAALQHWQASAWLLERRWPKEFGQQVLVRQQVVDELEEVLDRLERQLDPETFRRVAQIIADVGDGAAETADFD